MSQSERHEWLFLQVLQLPPLPPAGLGTVNNFKSHNKPWKLTTRVCDEWLMVTVACMTHCNKQWDVKVGIVDESAREITVSKAEKSKQKNTFKVYELIHVSQYRLIKEKVMKAEVSLFVEIKAKGGEKTEMKNAGKRKIEKDFEKMLLNGINSDVNIKVKRNTFKCHKGILRVRSPVFCSMLEHEMKEKISGVVKIEDVNPTTFQDFLLYLYTGSNDHLSLKNVTGLYKLGDKYAVEDLKSLCVEYIKENITVESFFEFFQLSQLHNDSELTDTTVQFFAKNSEEIIENKKWLIFLSEISVENISMLMKALKSNNK